MLNPSEASVHFVKRIKSYWLTEDSRGNEAKIEAAHIVQLLKGLRELWVDRAQQRKQVFL